MTFVRRHIKKSWLIKDVVETLLSSLVIKKLNKLILYTVEKGKVVLETIGLKVITQKEPS